MVALKIHGHGCAIEKFTLSEVDLVYVNLTMLVVQIRQWKQTLPSVMSCVRIASDEPTNPQ